MTPERMEEIREQIKRISAHVYVSRSEVMLIEAVAEIDRLNGCPEVAR